MVLNLENTLLNWREFATVKRWISQMQRRNEDKITPEKTLEAMKTWFPQYLKFHKKTPDELIEEALSDSDLVQDRLDDFYRFKNKSIDRNSCITGIYGVLRGFYRHNKINVQEIIAPKFSPRQVKKTDSNYPLFTNVEHIVDRKRVKKLVLNRPLLQEFCGHLTPRDQCILLCVLSSGLDSNDILKLTVGDVRMQDEHSRIYLNDVRNKTFQEYKSFFSVEATTRLRSYIKKERNYADDEEPLFVTTMKGRKSQFKKITCRSYKLGDDLPRGNKVQSSDLSDAFRLAQKSMGVILQKGKQSPLRPKRFRKVFKTACSNAHLDSDIIKTFLGHSGESSQTYQEESRDTLEFYYEMVESRITLFQDESFEREEVVDMKSRMITMQKELDEMKRQRDRSVSSVDMPEKEKELARKLMKKYGIE